jgi:hypothetical protein
MTLQVSHQLISIFKVVSFLDFTTSAGFNTKIAQALQMTLTALGGFWKPFKTLISFGSNTPKAYSAACKAGIASLTAVDTIASSSPIETFNTSAYSFSLVTMTILASVSSLATTNLGYMSMRVTFIPST